MECKLHTLLVKRSIKYTMNSERFLRLYDTETGQRLPAPLGGEVIELSQVQVMADKP